MKKRIFLGGTCNESTWRNTLIYHIDKSKYTWFNPVVDDWDEKAYQNELKERKECDIVLYTITQEMTGVYSIAEVIDDSNKRPEKTIFCLYITDPGYDKSKIKSLEKVGQMVEKNGGKYFNSMNDLIEYLDESSTI